MTEDDIQDMLETAFEAMASVHGRENAVRIGLQMAKWMKARAHGAPDTRTHLEIVKDAVGVVMGGRN